MFLEQLQTVSGEGSVGGSSSNRICWLQKEAHSDGVSMLHRVWWLSRLAAVIQLCILLVARVEPELRLGRWGVCVISVHSAKSRGL